MIKVTKEEKHLKIFMVISAMTYLVVGFAFALLPEQILEAFNLFSRVLALLVVLHDDDYSSPLLHCPA
jgi:hypothetical protein